jgi:WD40 repeat protein
MVKAVAFSPDGKHFVTAVNAAQFWDAATGRAVGKPLRHPEMVEVLRFSPDGKLLLLAGGPGAQLWLVAAQKPLGPPLPHPARVLAGAFSPDGRSVVTGTLGGHVRLWNVPAPAQGSAERLALWAQVHTGLELDEEGAPRLLDAAVWEQRRRRLQGFGE